MGLLANLPFALSAGIYFAYIIVLGFGYSWQIALMAVFVEGVIFIILSLAGDFRFRAGVPFFCAHEQKKPQYGGDFSLSDKLPILFIEKNSKKWYNE